MLRHPAIVVVLTIYSLCHLRRNKSLGKEEGISIGLERGAYQKALETARAFLLEGLAPAMVARCTDLPLETVLELAQKR